MSSSGATGVQAPPDHIKSWGEFASPDLEDRFRRAHLRFDTRQTALAVGLALAMGLLFIPTDFRLFGSGVPFRSLLAFRMTFLAGSIALLAALRRGLTPTALDRSGLAWAWLGTALLLYVGSTRTGVFFLGWSVTQLLALFLLYIVLPFRLSQQIALGCVATGVGLGYLLPTRTNVDPVVRDTVIAAYVLGNLMGAAVSWNLRHLKRQQFASLERLESAMAEVKTLRGILPICAHCKKVRNDAGYWQQVEVYVRDRTEAEFSHGICPECLVKHYPDAEASNPTVH